MCWQHAEGLLHAWRSLTRNQTIQFVGLLLGLLLTVTFGWLGLRHSPTKQEIAKEVVKELPPPPRQHDVEKPLTETLKTDAQVKVQVKRKRAAEKPPVGNITQGPGSITQIGGVGNQATIIGEVPTPPRALSAEQFSLLTAAASQHPFRILILYANGDDEAYHLAKQIGDALTAGGWTLKQPVTGAVTVNEGGGPLFGMSVTWRGDRLPPGSSTPLDPSTPWGAVASQLYRDFPDDFTVLSAPEADENFILLAIDPNPKSKRAP